MRRHPSGSRVSRDPNECGRRVREEHGELSAPSDLFKASRSSLVPAALKSERSLRDILYFVLVFAPPQLCAPAGGFCAPLEALPATTTYLALPASRCLLWTPLAFEMVGLSRISSVET